MLLRKDIYLNWDPLVFYDFIQNLRISLPFFTVIPGRLGG